MEEILIGIINHFSFNIAFVILLSAFVTAKKKRFFMFFVLTFSSVIFNDFLNLVMPALLLIGIIFFYSSKDRVGSIYQIATPLTLCVVLILIVGTVVGVLTNRKISTLSYNLICSLSTIVLSVFLSQFLKHKHSIPDKTKNAIIIIEVIVILFFSFGDLLLYNYSYRKLSILLMFCLLIIISIICLVGQITMSDLFVKQKKEENQLQKEQIFLLEKGQEDILKLKHFYLELYQSIFTLIKAGKNLEALEYFEQYVIPVHNEHLTKSNINIDNNLIKSYLINFTNKIHKSDSFILLELKINEPLHIPKEHVLNVFKVLAVTTDNAFQYLVESELQTFILELSNTENNDLKLSIKNSVLPNFDLAELEQKKTLFNGYGFGIIEELLETEENVSLCIQKLEQFLIIDFLFIREDEI